MINNTDLLMFLVSVIFAIVLVIWIASGNNKVRNYGVGENDLPETSRPLLPGERTNNDLSKGSIYNQYNCNKLPEPSYYPLMPPKEDIKYINRVCGCGCKNVDVMSVVKRQVEVDEKEFNVVDITYICTDCGNMKTETEYLYER